MERARIVAWSAQMRRVHQRLADALVIARESIASGDPAPPSFDPLTHCWAFCAGLDGHHNGEDTALFPRLVQQRPELAEVVDNLARDHRMIGHLLGGLRHSMSAGDPPAALLRHLDGIEAVMTTHFRYEEKRLLGVLDSLDLVGLPPDRIFGPLA
ncbi:MAG TPA: hemerythrin domain-containing protein [Nakamurella sp.]